MLITFSEDVGNTFTAGDFNKSPGVTVTVTKISPTEYIATFTPTASGTVSFIVRSNSVRDAAGNGNGQSNIGAINVALGVPTVTITAPTTTQTGAFDVTITFSENVTGFEASDISFSGTGNCNSEFPNRQREDLHRHDHTDQRRRHSNFRACQ